MASDDDHLDSMLERYMGQAGEPPEGQVASSVEAVWERLRPEAEFATLPARLVLTRRSHLSVAAVVVIAAAAIGLFAFQRAGLLQRILPAQPPAPPQVAPDSQSPAVAVAPVHERAASGGVADSRESKEPAISSKALVGVAVAETPLSERIDAGASPLQRIDGKPSQDTTRPGTSLAFEVALIRPIPPPIPTGGSPWTVSEGRFRTERGFLRGVIELAYGMRAGQVKGGPDWIDRAPYEFDARAGSVAAGPDQIRSMIQTLLRERFKLAIHFDSQEATVYTLVVAKNGPKLQNAKGGQPYGNWTGRGQVTLSNMPLLGLTNILSGLLDHAPVLDETGLRGAYDLSLEFIRPGDPPPSQADSPPDLFAALQEQLGLELRATKRRVEVVVIDHIERPPTN